MLQQIDKESFKKQIKSYRTRIESEEATDELFEEIKAYLKKVLKLRGKAKWLEKDLCEKIKIARHSCNLKKIRKLSKRIIEIEDYLQEE